MKAVALIIVMLLCPGAATWAQESEEFLGLPQWSERELDAMRQSDGGAVKPSPLWPGIAADVSGMSQGFILGAASSQADSPEAQQPHTDVSKFLPPALIIGTRDRRAAQMAQRQQAHTLREVDPRFLLEVEGLPPGQHLLDPSHQLPEVVRDDLERFLESHARDARVALHLLVLPPDQKLPSAVNLAKMAQGSLLQKDCCLAVCPLGEPWRLRLFMSSAVRDRVPTAELSQIIDDAIRGAMQTMDSEEQLHRLLIRLSIRLFWLEPSLADPVAITETIAKALPSKTEAPALLEIIGTEVHEPSLAPWSSLTWAAALFLVVALGFLMVQRWRRYQLRHCEWVLPEPPAARPRFDCPHGATVAMIHYQ